MSDPLTMEQLEWLAARFEFSTASLLPVHGSRRSFVLLTGSSDKRLALIDDDPDQFQRYLSRTKLFQMLGLRVPALYDADEALGVLLVEFLNGQLLEEVFHRGEDYKTAYRQVIEVLAAWQGKWDAAGINDADLQVYTAEFARAETRYFQRCFLGDYLNLPESQVIALDSRFDELANNAADIPRTFIHRDFQSQNIIIGPDGTPGFVDYQSAMVAPETYDLASLLYDNYVSLTSAEKTELLDYFLSLRPQVQRDDFHAAALQRVFQALGAYGNLSVNQGKQQYIEYIPQGLTHLRQLAEHFPWVKEELLPRLSFGV